MEDKIDMENQMLFINEVLEKIFKDDIPNINFKVTQNCCFVLKNEIGQSVEIVETKNEHVEYNVYFNGKYIGIYTSIVEVAMVVVGKIAEEIINDMWFDRFK